MRSKKLFAVVLFVVLAALGCAMSAFATTINPETDAVFTCDSDPADFNGKTFENLTINLDHCGKFPNKGVDPYAAYVVFENITVNGEVNYEEGYDGQYNHYVNFYNSTLNTVNFSCAKVHNCEIGLNKGTSIQELNLYPAGTSKGKITVNGLINDDLKTYKSGELVETLKYPELYGKNVGMIADDNPVWTAIFDTTSERKTDPETGAMYYTRSVYGENEFVYTLIDTACIERINYHNEADSAIQLENVWVNNLFILPEAENAHPSIFTYDHAVIALLDSGVDFTLRKAQWTKPFSVPCSGSGECWYMPDYTNAIVLTMILHSDTKLNVSMDAAIVAKLLFFGSGADKSTLRLEQSETMFEMPVYKYIYAYGSNVEIESGLCNYLYFLEKRNDLDYANFYEILTELKDEITASENGELPRETDSEILSCKGQYTDRFAFERNINFWGVVYFISLPYAYAEENHAPEANIPYIFVRGAAVDHLLVSKNYQNKRLPSYFDSVGITNKSLLLRANGAYLLGTQGGCQFAVFDYRYLDIMGVPSVSLLTCDESGHCTRNK